MQEQQYKCPFCEVWAAGLHRLVTHVKGCSNFPKSTANMDELINAIRSYDDKRIKECLKEVAESGSLDDNLVYDPPTKTNSSRDLSDYFAETPICREERQYALWLVQCLQMKDNGAKRQIISQFERQGKIEQVYFEVTMMRDFWNACTADGRKEFNNKLFRFVDKEGSNQEHDQEKHPNFWKSPALMRWMMNAKPDIAVLVKETPKIYRLYFIECKYKSDETRYRDKSIPGNNTRGQCEVQKDILKFLCETDEKSNLGIKYRGKAILPGKEIIKVQFVDIIDNEDYKNKKKTNEWVNVSIKELREELKIYAREKMPI